VTGTTAFLECADCRETHRVLGGLLRRDSEIGRELEEEARGFSLRHASCRLLRWLPCGDATSDLPSFEPLAAWSVPVRRDDDPSCRAVARGAREDVDGPLGWRILRGDVAAEPRLDREQLRALLDLALERSDDLPRNLAAWADWLELFLRRLPARQVAALGSASGANPGQGDGAGSGALARDPAGAPSVTGPETPRREPASGSQLDLDLGEPSRTRPSPARAPDPTPGEGDPAALPAPAAG